MKFRFIKVTSFYPNFLESYYKSNPELITKSYEEQHKHLMNQGYGYSDYFPRYLQQNYSIPGTELIHNAKALQSAWAREHGSELTGNRLLLEQLKTYEPEILFIQDSANFSASFIQKIREEVASLKLIIGHCCAPYNNESIKAFRQYNVILACSERFLEDFRKNGISSYLFPHAIESTLISQMNEIADPVNEIIFIGSLLFREEFHKKRISYIEEIFRNKLPLHMYGQLETDPWHLLKMKQTAYLAIKLLTALNIRSVYDNRTLQKIGQLKEIPRKTRHSSSIRKNIRTESVFGKKMLELIGGYAIGFNQHGEVAGDYAANVRMFEVTGAGALLVTDDKKNIPSLFEPDKEILTYKSIEECIEKLQWAISHPAEARSIALAGQQRALREHSVEKRVDLLHEIIQKEL
ncbi:MAG: glycosyltransferase family 1 protein [Bacteroidetes bacterium]|nr:glycosyltransferase family 1 protein [Bacteroidota bacterium]